MGLVALIPIAACSSAISLVDVESARTTAQVMTALVNDPEIGTRPIDVRVFRGVVRLSGQVRSQAEVARAIALVRAVPGVTQVDSSIRVGAELPRTQPPPADRRPAARDPAVEFAELERAPGRLAIGGSVVVSRPAAALESAWSAGPLVRFGSGTGFRAAMAFDWYAANLIAEPGLAASRLRVRPIMAGLAYTVAAGRVSISPTLVGGYAFNSIAAPNAGAAARLTIDADNSLVWRPGVSVWIDTGRRTAATFSVGRLRTRLNVTFIDAGVIEQRTMRGDATMVSIGLAYTLF
jgi:hypothetical protein